MKIKENGNNGSEIHRLKPMQENYDKETFDRMYKICKPVIRRLTKQIDNRRFNVTPDIISSYFWDKMLFVFNKYYGTCEEEHLKARILASLSTFKNHLLRTAYGEGAEYHQNLYQLEDLFDKYLLITPPALVTPHIENRSIHISIAQHTSLTSGYPPHFIN